MLLSVVRMLVSRCRSGLGTLNKVVSFFRKGMHDLHPQESGIPGPALPCTGPRGGGGGSRAGGPCYHRLNQESPRDREFPRSRWDLQRSGDQIASRDQRNLVRSPCPPALPAR